MAAEKAWHAATGLSVGGGDEAFVGEAPHHLGRREVDASVSFHGKPVQGARANPATVG
jgi:hypothetical protein